MLTEVKENQEYGSLELIRYFFTRKDSITPNGGRDIPSAELIELGYSEKDALKKMGGEIAKLLNVRVAVTA